MKQLLLSVLATAFIGTVAQAQILFTGGIAIGGASQASFTTTTLNLGSANTALFENGDGTFDPIFALNTDSNGNFVFQKVALTNPNISGISGTLETLTGPLPTFELTSRTTPGNEYAFQITGIGLLSGGSTPSYFGTGQFVDNTGTLATTGATFTLGFSGPNAYSFSASADTVPEPSTWAMTIGGVGALLFWKRRASRI